MGVEIKNLGHDTFLVGRRVIKADVPGMFDLSKQEDRDELIRLSRHLYESPTDRACFGELTVCALRPVHPDVLKRFPTAKYDQNQFPFRHLHDAAKKILREEFPEYADRI